MGRAAGAPAACWTWALWSRTRPCRAPTARSPAEQARTAQRHRLECPEPAQGRRRAPGPSRPGGRSSGASLLAREGQAGERGCHKCSGRRSSCRRALMAAERAAPLPVLERYCLLLPASAALARLNEPPERWGYGDGTSQRRTRTAGPGLQPWTGAASAAVRAPPHGEPLPGVPCRRGAPPRDSPGCRILHTPHRVIHRPEPSDQTIATVVLPHACAAAAWRRRRVRRELKSNQHGCFKQPFIALRARITASNNRSARPLPASAATPSSSCARFGPP